MICMLAVAASSYLSYLVFLCTGLIPNIEYIPFLRSFVHGFVFAVSLLFASPLFLGCYRLFLLIARNEKPRCMEIFYYFQNRLYKAALSFGFSLFLRVLARFVLSFIPLAAVLLLSVFTSFKNIDIIWGTAIISIAAVFGIALFVYLSVSLFYAPIAFTLLPTVSTSSHFRRSKEICRKQKGEIILFFLSFIPWYLLCFFIIPIIWAVPYFSVSMIILGFNIETHYSGTASIRVSK